MPNFINNSIFWIIQVGHVRFYCRFEWSKIAGCYSWYQSFGSRQNLAYMVNLFTESLSLELNLFLLTRFPLNFGMSLGSEIHSVSPSLYSFDSRVSHNWMICKGGENYFSIGIDSLKISVSSVYDAAISCYAEFYISGDRMSNCLRILHRSNLESRLTGKGRPRFIEVYPSSIL